MEASKPSTTEQTSECNPPPSVNAAALHCRCPNICAVKLRYRRPAMPPLRYSTTLQLTTLAASAALQRPARRCAATTALPLPTHCAVELRCAQRSAAALHLPRCHCQRHAAAANALRCRAALQQRAADLRRHHCAQTLRCSCQRLALPPLRCSSQRRYR